MKTLKKRWREALTDSRWWLCIILLTTLILCNCTTTPEKWTKTNYALHSVMTTAMAADWLQTRYIATHPDKYYEMNPILGKHPSKTEVNLFFLGAWVFRTGVTHFTKSKYRFIPQIFFTAETLYFVNHNHNIGIGFEF